MAELAQLEANPFFVLGLHPDCSRIEMEREGQKWLAMLEIGFAGAQAYATPLGERERTPELVREAMAILRDPDRRLLAELWARTPVETGPPAAEPVVAEAGDQWTGAMKAMGWK